MDISNPQLTPIDNNKRIQVMDLLRGFALIGILFMNIEWFNRPVSMLLAFDYQQTGLDWSSSWLVKVFIEGKFYKLFSLLFGMGFAVMLIQAQKKERPFGAWFIRRMLALLVFGMAHASFLWGGDILRDYAIAGLMLLGFVFILRTKRCQKFNHPKTFLKVGSWLLLFPLIATLFAALFFGVSRDNSEVTDDWQQKIAIIEQSDNKLAELREVDLTLQAKESENAINLAEEALEETEKDEKNEIDESTLSPEELIAHKVKKRVKREQEKDVSIAEEVEAFTNGSYGQATAYRAMEAVKALAFSPIFALMVCLPLFMIGYWLVASERLKNPELHQDFFNVMCWGGLGLGLMLNISSTFLTLHPAAQTANEISAVGNTLSFYGQIILAAGYIGLFVKLTSKAWFMRAFSWLALLGKMALTNYISHSIILSSIFYGYAGGMFGKIARAEQMLIVVAIIFCQVIICKVWLKYFQFGPLEWLWRSMTYLKLQPMRINK